MSIQGDMFDHGTDQRMEFLERGAWTGFQGLKLRPINLKWGTSVYVARP